MSKDVRRINVGGVFYTTNDVSGGPWGGGLRGTGENDKLADGDGEDEVYALGGDDRVEGGPVTMRSTGVPTTTNIWRDTWARTCSTAGAAATCCSPSTGSGTNSIAGKARTSTMPTRSTMWPVAAR